MASTTPPHNYVGYRQEDREEIAILQTRMSVMERALSDISATLTGLAMKIDKKGETNWQAYAVMLSALIALGGALYLPVSYSIQETKERVRSLEVEHYNGVIRDLGKAERIIDEYRRRLQ